MATTLFMDELLAGSGDLWVTGKSGGNLFNNPGFWDIGGTIGACPTGGVVAGLVTSSAALTGSGTWPRNAVAGPTAGITHSFWLSYPLAAGVTIAGSITFQTQASESAMTTNATLTVRIYRVQGDGTLTAIVTDASRGTELSTTFGTVSWSFTPTSTAFSKGDRILVFMGCDDATAVTMGAGGTIDATNGNSAGTTGQVVFTETLTFETTTAPAGTQFFLRDTSAGIDPGSATEKLLDRSRGASTTTSVTNTAAGPTAGIQLTATAGGTAVEWYSPQLQAFTLSGVALVNFWGQSSDTSINTKATYRAEIAVCSSDGTGATVWGTAIVKGGAAETIDNTDRVWQALVNGRDVSVTDGQRLRLRIYIDDHFERGSDFPMVTGKTVTLRYDGATGGSTGDSYITFMQTVSDFSVTYQPRNPGVNFQDPGFFMRKLRQGWHRLRDGVLVPGFDLCETAARGIGLTTRTLESTDVGRR